MRVLICGGREWTDPQWKEVADRQREWSRRRLSEMHLASGFTVVIHGAARGADTLAGDWAKASGLEVEAYPAQWSQYGRGAGFIRNRQMLEEGKPDLVVAFPGGRGTAMMVRLAEEAGVTVWDLTKEWDEFQTSVDWAQTIVGMGFESDQGEA